MKKILAWKSIIALVVLLLSSSLLSAAPSEGGLYWLVEQYPDNPFPYDRALYRQGGEEALQSACRKNSGGTYTGVLRIQYDMPARKEAFCMVRFFSGSVPRNLYRTDLYCNGVKRYETDDSPCAEPPPPFDQEPNTGPPPCPDQPSLQDKCDPDCE